MKQILPLIRIQLLEFLPVKALRNTNDDAARKRARKRLTSTLVTFLACRYMAVASPSMLEFVAMMISFTSSLRRSRSSLSPG